MILSVFLMILFYIVLTGILFFIFYFLLQAMNGRYDIKEIIFPLKKEYDLRSSKGLPYTMTEKKRAVVLCSPDKTISESRLVYSDIHTCRLFNAVYATDNDCRYTCVGFGDCVYQCPQQAIVIQNKTAVITDLCIGCGRCVAYCPKHLITLIPKETEELVTCAAPKTEQTTCSMCQKKNICTPPANNTFKFWQSCYTLLKGRL